MPTAIVTGSNGKTTTVRLLAACAREHGWPSAFCCTDGVFFDGQLAVGGDYSGPEGARRVIRERRAQAAVIETARGGILRRGLAISRARVAVVTNVSADHFGEYGIDDLAGLADVKLTVGGVVGARGLCWSSTPTMRNSSPRLLPWRSASDVRRRWPGSPWMPMTPRCARTALRGGSTCGVREGRLLLHHAGRDARPWRGR